MGAVLRNTIRQKSKHENEESALFWEGASKGTAKFSYRTGRNDRRGDFCEKGRKFITGIDKLLGAVDTRRYRRAENRVWSDQEVHEERGSKDRAASTCGPHSDSFNDTSRRRRSNCSTNNFQHFSEANLKSKRPFRGLPLTPEHRQLCLQWCQARSTWNVTDWQNVVFIDESRFVLGTDDNRVGLWRCPGERYNPLPTVLRHAARTAGAMVQVVIAHDSRTTLIVMRGILTSQRYVDDILRPPPSTFPKWTPRGNFPAR
ncbi:hypothetical protein TNCV_3937241 [Trichonephila clavipes]|nr:hypothetical protein TNCV_3937241 [Trichonephila clavipes]